MNASHSDDIKKDMQGQATAHVQIESHRADFRFSLDNPSNTISIENEVVDEVAAVDLWPKDYLSVFDYLYPRTFQGDLESIRGILFSQAHLLVNQSSKQRLEVLLFPLVHQQDFIIVFAREDSQIVRNASLSMRSYRVTVDKGSTQIFVSCTFFILVFALIFLCFSKSNRIPDRYCSSDIDLISKLNVSDDGGSEGTIFSRLRSHAPWKMVTTLQKVRLVIRRRYPAVTDLISLSELGEEHSATSGRGTPRNTGGE